MKTEMKTRSRVFSAIFIRGVPTPVSRGVAKMYLPHFTDYWPDDNRLPPVRELFSCQSKYLECRVLSEAGDN